MITSHNSQIEPIFGSNRKGDIPHSQASIEKGSKLLEYKPEFSAVEGFEMACEWYFYKLK